MVVLRFLFIVLLFDPPALLFAQEDSVDPDDVIDELNNAAEASEAQDEEADYEPEGDDRETEPPQPESVLDQGQGQEHEGSSAVGAGGARISSTRQTAKSEKVFGAYRIHLGATKLEFDKADEYELVYGNSRWVPTFAVDYFFFDWYATLGLIFRVGYYKDDGHAVVDNGDGLVADKDGKTELTLVPLQFGLSGQLTPFPAKWLVLSGWFAGEATYFQETRLGQDSDTDSGSSTSSSSENDTVLTNTGWRYGTNIGLALSIILNGLDPRAVSSLNPIGIGAVYFTPYIEYTTGIFNESDFDLARTGYGAAFTFETL